MPHCHCCGGAVTNNTDVAVHCSLCKGMTYCSEQCAMIDWAMHSEECPNVIQIDSPMETIFRPYNFEDVPEVRQRLVGLQTSLPNDEIFQSYQLRHVAKNGEVMTKQIDSDLLVEAQAVGFSNGNSKNLRVGKNPGPHKGTYTINLLHDGISLGNIEGLSPNDMIYRGNRDGGRKYSRMKRGDDDGYAFWPAPANTIASNIILQTVSNKPLTVMLHSGDAGFGEFPINVEGRYIFAENKARDAGPTWKNIVREEQKYGLKASNARKIRRIKGEDAYGNKVYLTFEHINPVESKLLDIKMLVPEHNFRRPDTTYYYSPDLSLGNETNTLQLYSSIDGQDKRDSPFECDAADIDDVTALCMAIEHRMAEHQYTINSMIKENDDPANVDLIEAKQHLDQMQKHFSAISDHRIALENAFNSGEQEMDIPSNVHVTINSALDMFALEPIQGRYRRQRIQREVAQLAAAGTFKIALDRYTPVVNRLIGELQQRREDRETARIALNDDESRLKVRTRAALAAANGRVGRTKRHLEDIRDAFVAAVGQKQASSMKLVAAIVNAVVNRVYDISS